MPIIVGKKSNICRYSVTILPSFYLRSMCVLGKRLLKDINIKNCSKEVDGILWNEFCVLNNNTKDRDYIRNPELFKSRELNWNCDPYFAGMTYAD